VRLWTWKHNARLELPPFQEWHKEMKVSKNGKRKEQIGTPQFAL